MKSFESKSLSSYHTIYTKEPLNFFYYYYCDHLNTTKFTFSHKKRKNFQNKFQFFRKHQHEGNENITLSIFPIHLPINFRHLFSKMSQFTGTYERFSLQTEFKSEGK